MSTYTLTPQTAARIRHALKIILCGIVGTACVYLTFRITDLIAYELQAPYNADSPLFWAVGRGILNGLTPYRDLFETKPPGIFLLSSLSLWYSPDGRLGAFLQGMVFLLLPVAVAIGALRAHRSLSFTSEILMALLAIAFGGMLSLYSGERSGEFQVESFGALMACCYAVVIAWDPRTLGMRRMLTASFFLAAAIGFKEPFVLSGLAIALILAQHPRDIMRSFVYPALIAGIAGVTILALFGYLEPYLTIYLPEMLGKHIHGGAPLWRRGFEFRMIYDDLNVQSSMLAVTITTLLAGSLLLRLRSHDSWMSRAFGAVSMVSAVYLTSLSIGVGGHYWNHHFVFAVPVYAALFFVCARELRRHWSAWEMRIAATTAAVLLSLGSFQHQSIDYAARLQNNLNHRIPTIEAAREIDAVLDTCGVERYLFLGANGSHPFGFTKHSPIGPLFMQYDYWMDEQRPEFRRAILDAVDAAGFIVLDSIHLLNLTDAVKQELEAHFSPEPWPCAKDVSLGNRYQYLFRTSDDLIPLSQSAL